MGRMKERMLRYPTDVAAGCLVGLGSAVIVVRLGRPLIARSSAW